MPLTSYRQMEGRDNNGRFLPGSVANPKGALSRKPITDAINMELAMLAEGRVDPIPKLSIRQMVRAQIIKACEGDVPAWHAIVDRVEGKPKQTIAGDEENPLQIALSRGQDARDMIASAIGRLVAPTIEGEAVSVDSTESDTSQPIDKPTESK